MQARALTASFDRLSAGRIRAVALSAVVLAATVAAPTAVLAKGPTSGSSPWIALASVNGVSAATVQPALGSSVNFNSGYPTSTKNPWVSLTCIQNGVVVYGEGGSPSDTFSLGGAASQWLTNGGAASCTAELGNLYWNGGQEYYTYLASTSFTAGG